MAPRTTMQDVARRAGVSVATVSHVINGTRSVGSATAARVQEAIAEFDYVRNESARQLRVGRASALALLVLDLSNPYFMEVAAGMEARAAADDVALIVGSSQGDPVREARLLRSFIAQGVRGVAVTPQGATVERLEALRHDLPRVTLVDVCGQDPRFDHVGVDDELGGDLAITHLVELGHRSIGVINGPHTLPHCAARWHGACQAAARAGLSLIEEQITSPAADRVEAAFERLRARRSDLTAVFVFNDLSAFSVLTACLHRGIAVPQELSIIGYDDIDFAEHAVVPLTTVRQPVRNVGWAAADVLLRDPDGAQTLTFEPTLVRRSSTAQPPRRP